MREERTRVIEAFTFITPWQKDPKQLGLNERRSATVWEATVWEATVWEATVSQLPISELGFSTPARSNIRDPYSKAV